MSDLLNYCIFGVVIVMVVVLAWFMHLGGNKFVSSTIVRWEDADSICYIGGKNGYISCVRKR